MKSKSGNKTECKTENCQLDACDNGQCILYSDKKNKNKKVFWKKIREQIKKQDNSLLDIYIQFDSVFFPQFEEKGLAEIEYDKGNNFFENGSVFNKKFKLTNCTFLDEADFSHIKFSKGLTFDNCIFENGLNIKNSIFNKYEKFRIQNCSKIVNANFENTTFGDLVDFYNSIFIGDKTTFEKTTFLDIVVFSKSTFIENINFKYTTFDKLAQFKNTTFEKKLNLEDTIIKEEANFLHIKQKDGKNLKSENIANRETARIIKNSFEKQKNIIEANKYYALEMKKYEQELSWYNDFSNKLIFMIHGKSSNHSQNWLLILFWIVIVSILGSKNSFVCSLYYFCISDEPIKYIAQSFAKIFTFKIKDITLYSLLIKASMSYLIYQFIITVRQNTRRK